MPAAQRYTLTVAQRTPPTPGQPDKQPLVIPVAMGLLDGDGTGTADAARRRSRRRSRHARAAADRGGADASTFDDVPARRCRRCCAASRRR